MLGKERRGDAVSSYKGNDDNSGLDDDWELPSEDKEPDMSGSKSRVEEFEEWKKSMRQERKSDSSKNSSADQSSSIFDRRNMQQATNSVGIDDIFDSSLLSNQFSGSAMGGFSHKASRFSSFFKTESDQRQMPYPGPEQAPRFGNGMTTSPESAGDNDPNNFGRILAMLNTVKPNEANQQSPNFSKLSISENQGQQKNDSASSNDNSFFMSLLGKNGNHNNGDTSAGSANSVQSPPSGQASVSSIPKTEVSPLLHQSQMPGMPFPPPHEWLQAQANGQLPKFLPGMMPGMMPNMPPGMMPYPPPGMPNLPPNMMPPNMPPMMGPNGAPFPPGMSPMNIPMMMPGMPPGMIPPFSPGQAPPMPMGFPPQNMEEMNAQFGPRGPHPPMPGMPMGGPFPGPPGMMNGPSGMMPGMPSHMSPSFDHSGLAMNGKGQP